MKTLFIAYCTEYEAGWGQRPDGFMIGKSKEAMLPKIEESNKMGSYEYFWRYSEPKEVYCEDETYALIEKRMNGGDVATFDDKEEKNLNLFKKL